MPRSPAQPGRRDLSHARAGSLRTLEFQLLWHHVRITTTSDDVVEALRYLVQSARQHVAVDEDISIDVVEADGGYEISRDGRIVATAPDALGVLDDVYARVYSSVFAVASAEGWIRVHAALVVVDGRRILLTGPAGVGKTTLALRLLFDGVRVDADESVLLRGGEALAVPRAFHVKGGTEEHIPELAALLASLPTLRADPPVTAFDPAAVGFAWSIEPAAVDAVVVLRRAPATILGPASAIDMAHSIVEDAFLLHEPKASVVREVSTVLHDAPCFRLDVADVGEASALVRGLVEQL